MARPLAPDRQKPTGNSKPVSPPTKRSGTGELDVSSDDYRTITGEQPLTIRDIVTLLADRLPRSPTMKLTHRQPPVRPMNYVLLGSSGLRVSEFCLGTATFGEDGWGSDRARKQAHPRHLLRRRRPLHRPLQHLRKRTRRRDRRRLGTQQTRRTRHRHTNSPPSHDRATQRLGKPPKEPPPITPNQPEATQDRLHRPPLDAQLGRPHAPRRNHARTRRRSPRRHRPLHRRLRTRQPGRSPEQTHSQNGKAGHRFRRPPNRIQPRLADAGARAHPYGPPPRPPHPRLVATRRRNSRRRIHEQPQLGQPLRPRRHTRHRLEIADAVCAIAAEIGQPPAAVALAWLRQRPIPVMPLLGARQPSNSTKCSPTSTSRSTTTA